MKEEKRVRMIDGQFKGTFGSVVAEPVPPAKYYTVRLSTPIVYMGQSIGTIFTPEENIEFIDEPRPLNEYVDEFHKYNNHRPTYIELTDHLTKKGLSVGEYMLVEDFGDVVTFKQIIGDIESEEDLEEYVQLEKMEVLKLVKFLLGWVLQDD